MRTPTTGRFETRQELEEFVWYAWTKTKQNQTQVAKSARVSPGTVSNILNNPPKTK